MSNSSLYLQEINQHRIMSPRIKRPRKVLNPPVIKGFKPYGLESGKLKTEPIFLLYEEYEALRLCDYDMCNHIDASGIMNVSRPTFTRIYSSARQKIAKAFVEGRQIAIEGGKVYFDSDWYSCSECKCSFNNPEKDRKIMCCPLCGSQQIAPVNYNNEPEIIDEKKACNDLCYCPECGFEQEHQRGNPCGRRYCPECNALMKKKVSQDCEL